jgi:hypothetical protein
VTPRHHYYIMKHTWSFCNFLEIKSIAYTSPQMVLSKRSMVFISLPKAFEFAFYFHPTSKKAYVKLWVGMKYRGILASCILPSQTMDPRRCKTYTFIKMCKCVENVKYIFLYSFDHVSLFLFLLLRIWATFILSSEHQCTHCFCSWRASKYPLFFSYFFHALWHVFFPLMHLGIELLFF